MLFHHILVPTDFSPTAQAALDLAVELARDSHALLTLVHAVELPVYSYDTLLAAPMDLYAPVRQAAQETLSKMLGEVQKQVPGAASILRPGRATDEIIDAVRTTGADLVVIGTHGRTGLTHLLLGSVAEKVVRASPVPVLTVHGSAG